MNQDPPSTGDTPDPVTATDPESTLQVSGVDHITLIGSNEADTIEFYRDGLGMPLVLRQPNLDAPDVTHLFFDPGDGRLLTFFVSDDRESRPTPQQPGIGAVHHLSFKVEPDAFERAKRGLEDIGRGYNEFDRGAFHSLYSRDHNGLTIELSVDAYDIPSGRRGEVLALAHQRRVEAGAEYVDNRHVEDALEELGLPVEPVALPDAESGVGDL
ncbi:MAG: VOC family protein [Halodesulfurarchaeum sp.]